MPIEKDGAIGDLSRNFSEDEWRIPFILDNLYFESFDFESFHPSFDVIGSFFEKTIGGPLRIIEPGKVGNGNILSERLDQTVIENLIDVLFAFSR